MSNHTEIRWHGRGGQGAKTAALLLADVAFQTGKYVQGFPEYGPERMGAPITAYNRISDTVIRSHSNIYDPQYVVVVDESLLESVDPCFCFCCIQRFLFRLHIAERILLNGGTHLKFL